MQHQPDAFSSDMELLDTVSIGGGNDGGIDGIAIKVNNYLIKTQDEIDEFLKKGPLEIELIFIQAKNTKNFDSQELGSFISGVRAFLTQKVHILLMNKCNFGELYVIIFIVRM